MTEIRFDSGTKIRIDHATTSIAAAKGSAGACGTGGVAIAGVSGIVADGQTLTGDVPIVAGVGTSVSSAGGVVTISANGVAALRDLTDVAITTDGEGNPIIPAGAVLRFENYETGGVWIANETLDGGAY